MQLLDFFLPSALAKGEQVGSIFESVKRLDQLVVESSLQAVYVAAIALAILLFIAIILRNPSESSKRVLFWSIASIIVITTGLLIGMTAYLNQASVTKGPVHWHADFEIWACGTKQDLKDPEGIANKIGTPTLHEHGDLRIHVEGVVVDYPDVNLGAFFRVIGGELTDKSLTIPTNSGTVNYISGQKCPGSGQAAELQVFAITADLQNRTYSQRQIANPDQYQFTQDSRVPPGDCLIIEFAQPSSRTNQLCQSYDVAKVTGELTAEVPYLEDDGH